MFKKLTVLMALLAAASSFAAVDVNKATAAELDGINGIGPGLSNRILEERRKGNFKDWADLISRVSGVQESRARTLSAEGVTVNGMAFKPAPGAVAAQAPASAASAPAKPETKAEARARKRAEAKARAATRVKAAKADRS